MITKDRNASPPFALSDGYYYENGSTIASNVQLAERNYGTRRSFYFVCDPNAVQATLPVGWTLADTVEPESNLMLHFNDWLYTSHPENTPHAVQAPPYIGFIVPVQNTSLKRSGFMQIYGLAAGDHYTGGPYKAYRGCKYSHTSRLDTDGLNQSWSHEKYTIEPLTSAGVFEISIAHQRTVVTRGISHRPDIAVYSAVDNSIERYYSEDMVIEWPLSSSLGISNVKDFSLTWTFLDLQAVMESAQLVAMSCNPAYMREVFERDRL